MSIRNGCRLGVRFWRLQRRRSLPVGNVATPATVKNLRRGSEIEFPGDATVFYPQEDSMFSHNERKYVPQRLKEIDPAFIATMPAVVDAGEGAKLAIAESDVEDYPGMWLTGRNSLELAGHFRIFRLKEKLKRAGTFG